MSNVKILVAEDEAAIREFIIINLQRAGYDVIEAVDGLDAYEKYKAQSDDISIAVLDIMMPGMDGLELCKKLRSMSSNIGIMMLTAKTQEMDKVTGLLLGADDYITKPFSPSEFTARVDALSRRVAAVKSVEDTQANKDILVSGDFRLDCKSRSLTRAGKYIDITQVEFQIIEFFMQNQGSALSRTDILEHVWGSEYFGEEKIVDVNIRRIRKKIEDDPSNPKHLITIWGLGYKWI
ncbi:MAG: response regulator transcription factor [Clostridia bacterium]|nr:response regulator transcription factor [Clostridia bacterium]